MGILEQRIPSLLIRLGISAGIAMFYWYRMPHVPETAILSVITTLASVFATLLGFIITAVALLASLLDKPLIRNLQKTGHYRRLMTGAFDTCGVLLTLVLVCMIGLLLPVSQHEILITLLVCLVALSFLYLLQTGRRLFNVISVLS